MTEQTGWWIRYRTPIKAALLPFSFGWAVANRNGWLPAPPIGTAPYLNPRALERWRAAIADATVYLEYGAGGSSVAAVAQIDHVVSVETDARYLAAVGRRVSEVDERGSFTPIHVDIGWTSKWGQPVFTRRSRARLARWRRYPAAPWIYLEGAGLVPDFIFVDGRFRLASILESMLRLPDDADCLFMFDDFDMRATSYGPVLAFARDVERLDGTIAFRRKRDFDRDACRHLLERAYRDPF